MMGVVNNTVDVDNNNNKKKKQKQQQKRSRSRSLHLKMIIIFLIGIISVIRLLKQHLGFIIVPPPNNNTKTSGTEKRTTTTITKKIMKKQLSFDDDDNENASGSTLKKTAATTKQHGIRSNNIPSFNLRESSNNNNKRKNLQQQKHHHNIPASLKKPLFQTTTTIEDSNGQQQQQQQEQEQEQQHRKYYYEPIRDWGCSRTETPLIFVHLGKAGGGSIRARLAASAQNFTRYIDGSSSSSQSQWQRQRQQDGDGGDGDAALLIDDNHYYPISDTGDEHAYYCSSKYKHHRMIPNSTIFKKSMEGLLPCFAKTPIGMALACPEIVTTKKTKSKLRKEYIIIINNNSFVSRGEEAINNERCRGCQNLQSESCHTVYTGHNALGSELHWLPPKYLQNWWDSISTSISTTSSNSVLSLSYDRQPSSSTLSTLSLQIQEGLQRLEPYDQRWCIQYRQSRPLLIIKNTNNNNNMDPDDNDSDNDIYSQCSTMLSSKYDSLFEQYWQIQQQEQTSAQTKSNTTETTTTTTTMDYSSLYASMPLHRITMLREPFSWLLSKFYWHKTHKMGYKCDDDVQKSIGWIQLYCLDYLIKICGDDCANRLDYALQKQNNKNNNNNNSHDASSSSSSSSSSSLLLLEELEQQAANNLRRSFSVVGILNETESFYDMVTRRIKYIDMSLNPQIVGDIHPSIQHPTEETERCQKLFLQDENFQNILKNSIPIVATIDRLYQFGMKVNRHQMMELATCSSF